MFLLKYVVNVDTLQGRSSGESLSGWKERGGSHVYLIRVEKCVKCHWKCLNSIWQQIPMLVRHLLPLLPGQDGQDRQDGQQNRQKWQNRQDRSRMGRTGRMGRMGMMDIPSASLGDSPAFRNIAHMNLQAPS